MAGGIGLKLAIFNALTRVKRLLYLYPATTDMQQTRMLGVSQGLVLRQAENSAAAQKRCLIAHQNALHKRAAV